MTILSRENHMMLFEMSTEEYIQLKEIDIDKDEDLKEMKLLEK